jgi:1,2-diacylglycerol-3-alpha-glucose alpha-1,2-galactosyltransferase
MHNGKIVIEMLSEATSVDGQGVGSAYLEQVALVKEQSDLFEVYVNKLPHHVKADIRHVHTVNPQFRLLMNHHQPNVIYVHFLPTTLDGSIKLPKLAFHIFKSYVIKMYRHADEIVVVNPVFKKPLMELGMKEENITYIPNYVSKDSFHPLDKAANEETRKKYGIPLDAFVVMGCGQVQTRKGVVDFVKVAEANPDIQFVWAGGFSFGKITDGYKELKAIMDNPPKNVHFIGLIKRTEMNSIFNMCDLLFMPSFEELFPMSILEAVNSAKPVLLRDVALYKDILFEDYLKASDVEGWSKEIRQLKDDPAYYAEASKKSEAIATFYSKEHVASLWREYYPRILAKWQAAHHKK